MACLPSSLCSVCLDGALSGLVRWAGGSLLFLVMAFLILGEGEGGREGEREAFSWQQRAAKPSPQQQ